MEKAGVSFCCSYVIFSLFESVSNQVELKEFVKVGHEIYKVPKPSDPEDEAGKVVRRINNKQVENWFTGLWNQSRVTGLPLRAVTCNTV